MAAALSSKPGCALGHVHGKEALHRLRPQVPRLCKTVPVRGRSLVSGRMCSPRPRVAAGRAPGGEGARRRTDTRVGSGNCCRVNSTPRSLGTQSKPHAGTTRIPASFAAWWCLTYMRSMNCAAHDPRRPAPTPPVRRSVRSGPRGGGGTRAPAHGARRLSRDAYQRLARDVDVVAPGLHARRHDGLAVQAELESVERAQGTRPREDVQTHTLSAVHARPPSARAGAGGGGVRGRRS